MLLTKSAGDNQESTCFRGTDVGRKVRTGSRPLSLSLERIARPLTLQLDRVLARGATRAREVAGATLAAVHDKIGFLPPT